MEMVAIDETTERQEGEQVSTGGRDYCRGQVGWRRWRRAACAGRHLCLLALYLPSCCGVERGARWRLECGMLGILLVPALAFPQTASHSQN